jgi:DNA-binding NtrC family response regulator
MKKRVLIIDDGAGVLPESKTLIRGRGALIDVARSIAEAEALLELREYEIVIAGPHVTGSLGPEGRNILTSMKQDKALTGVILLVGPQDAKAAEEALSIGAEYYYEKNMFAKVLRDALKGLAV